ncbi:MAG: hypothetical protein ACE5JA_09785, partial [bacterium]
WSAVFNDAHTELVDCWYTIVNAYEQGWITLSQLNGYAATMGTPVTVADPNTAQMEKFTEAYAKSINDDMIYDAQFLSDIKSAWTAEAKAVYGAVQASVPTS